MGNYSCLKLDSIIFTPCCYICHDHNGGMEVRGHFLCCNKAAAYFHWKLQESRDETEAVGVSGLPTV